ncbi:hypothetical protein AAIG35_18630 [Cellulosimicrobium funkei]
MSTNEIDTMTNDAPRTRSAAIPTGMVTSRTSTPATSQATKLGRPTSRMSRPVP